MLCAYTKVRSMKDKALLATIPVTPIGFVRSSRVERVDDHWDIESSRIELDSQRYTSEALWGLEKFSHLEVLFFLHQLPATQTVTGARHPRERADWPRVGVFAQRGGVRPNRLGLSCCRILRIEGLVIHVEGLDAVEGTPVLDIKPYFREFGPRGSVEQPGWVSEIMRSYWKQTP